ncbi:MAG TPA: Xaa-Pro peptidase family protein [Mycobacteriales bacterium]|nr:Xaa-Pro peptidase family protein [Mycobacteriales bacterium]
MSGSLPSSAFTDRLARARKVAAERGVDALLITPGADLRYLVGYQAMPLERLTCLVLPAGADPVLVVPLLERPAALASPAAELGLEIRAWDETDDPFALVAGLLGPGSGPRLAVANRMWAEQVLRFSAAIPGADISLAGAVLHDLRLHKSAEEVEALFRAGAAIDAVHARMGEWLRPGRTEAAVGRDIADAMVAAGHEVASFTIVASGPNGASPHHHLSDRVIQSGDPVVVDIGGAMPDGYCSDCTRTYLAGGEPTDEFAAYYEVLRQAQQASVAAVRPGVPAERVDAAAREPIAAAGYGAYFVHRTGHGIGLEEHEDPYIVAGNTEPLAPGMAFSIEPGIYLPGRHGARIEDIVVCTETGVRPLNLAPHELVRL